jgi:hypothetical protein
LVEQLIRNQQVVGSSPTFGSISIQHGVDSEDGAATDGSAVLTACVPEFALRGSYTVRCIANLPEVSSSLPAILGFAAEGRFLSKESNQVPVIHAFLLRV